MTAADEKNEKSEKSEMTMAAPVVPAGGTQSLAGSETYDSYANSQMGRLTRIVAVHAGVSQPSTSQMLAERLAEGARRALEADSRLTNVEIIGLRPLAGDIARAGVGGPLSDELQRVVDALSAADGVVLVSPVFQASYSGLFKSAMDVLPKGTLNGAPVSSGGHRGHGASQPGHRNGAATAGRLYEGPADHHRRLRRQ